MSDRPAAVRGISLRELLPEAAFVGADDISVRSCSSDSRRCQPGDLFAALPGYDQNGHNFVGEARLRGAVAVLASQPLLACDLPVCIVPDSREAFGRVCQALAGQPGEQLKLIGITGTNGKTTSSYLTASVLVAGGYPTAVMGTLGCFDGIEKEPSPLTTPTAPVLATWLANSLANGCTHAVMEVSSHALCQSRVAGLNFDVACVTNVRHDHLDYHGDRSAYLAAKARLFSHLLPEGMAIVNRDDPGAASLLHEFDGLSLTVGLDAPAEVTATVLERSISEQTFLLSAHHETVPVRTSLIGNHNVYNCLIAAAVGQSYGLSLATIARGLERIRRIPGRLERVDCGQPFGVFVDYAHTPDALQEVLATLRQVTRGRLICVFGAGGDRDQLKRPWMGRAVENGADLAVITSDNPRSEDPQEIIGDVLTGFRNRSAASPIVDRAEAINLALAEARDGDCVLIAGKGHEQHQIIGDQCLEFDDYEFAQQALYEGVNQRKQYRASA